MRKKSIITGGGGGGEETSDYILFFLRSTISAFNSAQPYSEDNSFVNRRVPQGYTSCCLVDWIRNAEMGKAHVFQE